MNREASDVPPPQVGDLMVERDGARAPQHLICGSGWYPHAICVSAAPFVMVSEHGDMMWTVQKPENFRTLRLATEQERHEAFNRYHKRGRWAPPPGPNELREYGESA